MAADAEFLMFEQRLPWLLAKPEAALPSKKPLWGRRSRQGRASMSGLEAQGQGDLLSTAVVSGWCISAQSVMSLLCCTVMR